MKITVFLAMAFTGLLQIQAGCAATQLNTLSPSKWNAAMDVPIHMRCASFEPGS